MAETSEGTLKPTDFFVGIVDFFSILLPGALLTFLIITSLSEHTSQHPLLAKALEEFRGERKVGWVAFAIASYILGHRNVSMILRHLPKEFSVAFNHSGSWVLEG